MSFKVNSVTINPGDLLVAHRADSGYILVYPYSTQTITNPIILRSNVNQPAGLALFHWSGKITGDQEEIFNLLFYTSAAGNALYIYDLDNSGTLPENPVAITNGLLFPLFGKRPFAEPTSVDGFRSGDKAFIFVLNHNGGISQTIVRLSVDLATFQPDEPTIIASNFSYLVDIAYDAARDQLFCSQDDPTNSFGNIYGIQNASDRTTAIDGGTASSFITIIHPHGVCVPSTNREGSQGPILLVVQQRSQNNPLFQINIETGEYLQIPSDFNLLLPAAIRYDCTYNRIVFANLPGYGDLAINPDYVGIWEQHQ
jgi:hypothetical protein